MSRKDCKILVKVQRGSWKALGQLSLKRSKVKFYFRYVFILSDTFFNVFLEKEASMKEAESEAPKKGKGFVEAIRDWVRPATEKAQGISSYKIISLSFKKTLTLQIMRRRCGAIGERIRN